SPLIASGAGGAGAFYRFAVTVHDSAGVELTSQSWSQAVPQALLGVVGASLAEHFAFAGPRGRYVVALAVTDSATGGVCRAQAGATSPERLRLPAGGGVTRGLLDVAGLPPGAYVLDVTATVTGRDLTRSAEFGMAGFATDAAIAAAPGARPGDRFGPLAEGQLDSLYAPLVYLMSGDEEGIYPSLTLEGKRKFLGAFWARRDPTPGTSRNEAQEQFYAAIGEANRRFHEGGAAEIPGWRTDRGRVFIRYGAAYERLWRPQAGSTAPYEVWKYTKKRARKFVFY